MARNQFQIVEGSPYSRDRLELRGCLLWIATQAQVSLPELLKILAVAPNPGHTKTRVQREAAQRVTACLDALALSELDIDFLRSYCGELLATHDRFSRAA